MLFTRKVLVVSRYIVCFIAHILRSCQNLAPVLPTMQLSHWQFGHIFLCFASRALQQRREAGCRGLISSLLSNSGSAIDATSHISCRTCWCQMAVSHWTWIVACFCQMLSCSTISCRTLGCWTSWRRFWLVIRARWTGTESSTLAASPVSTRILIGLHNQDQAV